MPKIPSLKSLQNIFYDEKNCIEFLLDKDILNKPRLCTHCNSSIYRDIKIFRCTNRNCRKAISIFAHTFFARNHLRCSDIILIGYLWLCGSNYTVIQNIMDCSPNTISRYTKLFRQLIIDNIDEEDEVIGGDGIIVEVDESKFHSRKEAGGIWVIGGIEKTEEKKCFFKVVNQRDARTIREIISRHIKPGSIVVTDIWRGYQNIEDFNVTHETVNHGENFVDPISGLHTNTIEGTWAGLKLKIRPCNRSSDLISDHLLEFIWRRKNRDDLWNGLLDALRDYYE
jgi:IS1 family transposase